MDPGSQNATRRSKRQKEQQLQTELQNQSLEQMTVVNLRNLDNASLKKYKRVHRMQTKHGRPDENELYGSVVRHFATSEPPPQDETLEVFIQKIKAEKSLIQGQ